MKKKKNAAPVQAKPATMKKVEHRGLTAVQNPMNHHIMICRGGKMVYHAQYDHALIDVELRKVIDDYLVLAERMCQPR